MIRADCIIAVILVAVVEVDSQTLQRAREDVNASSSANATGDSSGKSKDDNGILGSFLSGLFAAHDDDGTSLGGAVVAVTVLAPFYAPVALLQDDYRERLHFAPHPYARSYRGYQILPTDMAEMFYETDATEVRRKNWAVRVSVENGNDFDGLNRLGGQLKVEHASRWGVVSSWNWFHEKLPCGCTDETVIGDANLTFRFAQNEIASMYAGMGFRMLSDRKQTDFGFNFTYGGDWFPTRPLVLSGVIDAGNLGSAGVFHARGSVGAIFHGWEYFGGYDFLRIGSVNLQGPMAGVRFWF